MLTGREQEITFLGNHYKRPGSQILVVYGQRGVGKTALLTAFTEKKESFLYVAENCSEREQCYQWGRELRERGQKISQYPSWREVLDCFAERKQETKSVLVIENFQFLLKGDTLFLQELIRFLKEQKEEQILVILSTYAAGWVENSMISRIGNLAFSISGFLKIKELPFFTMRRLFPGYTLQESIELYAALGGLPGLWTFLVPQDSVDDNLISFFLRKDSFFPELMMKWLLEELRETAVYDTILATIADGGPGKLNDLYEHTGFSRAKISVYLKNLMELELVEKVLPGTYEICNSFVRFYFRFLFPDRTKRQALAEKEFYEKYIRTGYNEFIQQAYRRICRDILQNRFREVKPWNAKNGKIYYTGITENGDTVVVDYSGTVCYTSKDYERLQTAMKSNRLTAGELIVFSEEGYEDALTGKVPGNLRCISIGEEI